MRLNRAFLYGDGVFESMRAKNGRIHLLGMHLDRLRKSLDILSIDYTEDLLLELRSALSESLKKNRLLKAARLRLTVFREGEGKFLPKSNRANYLIQVEALEGDFSLNHQGMKLALARNNRLYANPYSAIKTIGSQIYIQAALEKQAREVDELILLNQQGDLVEGCHSNLFIRKGKSVFSPPLSSGCLAGVMRARLFKLIPEMGHELSETELKEQDLIEADEVFLTNSISGVQWVGSYEKKRYFSNLSKQLIEKLGSEL